MQSRANAAQEQRLGRASAALGAWVALHNTAGGRAVGATRARKPDLSWQRQLFLANTKGGLVIGTMDLAFRECTRALWCCNAAARLLPEWLDC